jgi:ADP-heptose:LPS heptosyltransferase
MKICVIYISPKLGDIIFQLPFIKRLSSQYKTKVTLCINAHIGIKSIFQDQDYIEDVIENFFRRKKFFLPDHFKLYKELKKENLIKFLYLKKQKEL